MKRATPRRNVVLQRMADERLHHAGRGRRGQGRSRSSCAASRNQPPGIAPFFVEEIRKHLERQYGAKVLYENGLSVTTTLDAKLQEAANRAVESGLRRLDKRRGYRQPARNVLAEGTPSTAFKDERWTRPIAAGDVVPAVVVTAPKTGAGAPAARPLPAPTWAAKASPGPAAAVGGRSVQAGRSHRRRDRRRSTRQPATASVTLEQTPLVEGALVAIDNRTGPDQGDGRRLELRPQQVQPRGAGVPAARIDLQADRLHGGDRSRLHAGVDARRRAGQLPAGDGRSTARRTTTTSSRGRSRCGVRSRTRATFRRSR